MRRSLILLAPILLVCSAAIGQVDPVPRNEGYLVIETSAPDAIVMIDGEAIGPASESPFLLRLGEVEVTLIENSGMSWAPRKAEGSADIRPDETTTLKLELPVRYRIDSIPPGADIVLEADGQAEALGVAPLVLDRPEAMGGLLLATRTGHSPAQLAPGDSSFNYHTFMLAPLEEGTHVDAATMWVPPSQPRRWIDYASAGAALAAAGVAIYYKFEADAVDDRYRSPDSTERGDPLLKQEAERLDLYSLAALGVMQAGLAILTIRFILR